MTVKNKNEEEGTPSVTNTNIGACELPFFLVKAVEDVTRRTTQVCAFRAFRVKRFEI